MNELNNNPDCFNLQVLEDSVKFYLPRMEGYLKVIRNMARHIPVSV